MQHINIRGGMMAVKLDGTGDGPAVVFANSLGTDLRMFDKVVALLPAGLRIIRYDKRGHGLSAPEPASRSIVDHAADLAGLLDALGVRKALVAGVSIGGIIAQMLAFTRPDLVARLMIIDSAHKIGTPEAWNARIAAVRSGGMEAIAAGIMQRWFSPAFLDGHAGDVSVWQQIVTQTNPEGYIAACEAVRDADLSLVSPQLKVPTAFYAGTADLSTPPELVEAASRLVAGATFTLIDGVGHLPPLERPDVIAAAVLQNLERLTDG